MKSIFKIAVCAATLAALGACGEDRGSDGLSAEERERLNALAESQDLNNADLVDTSPDSLVADENAVAAEAIEGEEAANALANGAQ
jgi:hypothetical protein